jgi:hypothetical protein
MQRLVKKLLLSALLIVCAPLGFHRAQGERGRESNGKADAAGTSLSRVTDFTTYLSGESLEMSETRNAAKLRMIPFASQLLFLKEYSEIEE